MLPAPVEPVLRRRVRVAATASAVVGAVLAGAFTIVPASADTPAPHVRAVAGDAALTATWTRIADASRYTVKISEKKSFSHARTVHTGATTTVVRHLRNGHSYFVRVTAERTGIAATALTSTSVKVTAHRGAPTPVSDVRVVPGSAPNTLDVTWTGGDRMQKVGLVAGSNVTVTERKFHSAWYPATTRAITLTVPAKYRSFIGAGTGNPVYVRVAQSNSGSTTFHSTWDYPDRYRASTVGSWNFAKAPAAAGTSTPIRVAELNTQTNGASAGFSTSDQWAARLPRVTRLLESAKADLVLTAELSTNPDDDRKTACSNTADDQYRCSYNTQYSQLAKSLSGSLTLADPDAYARVMDEQRSAPSRYGAAVTDGAHVFYDPSSLTLVDHGFLSPALSAGTHFGSVTGLGIDGWMSTPGIGGDRWLTWAEFRTTDGRTFYAAAAHLPVGDSAAVAAKRQELGKVAGAWLTAKADGLPVVFGGDFNTDPTRSVKAVQPVLVADGWVDSSAVAKGARTNIRYNTTNASGPQNGADPGYPTRPYLQKWPTSRIDYVLLKNSPYPVSYENVLRRTAGGDFDHGYQGSDHNMQIATVGIGDPVS